MVDIDLCVQQGALDTMTYLRQYLVDKNFRCYYNTKSLTMTYTVIRKQVTIKETISMHFVYCSNKPCLLELNVHLTWDPKTIPNTFIHC